ncbi:protein of unknown function [Candidatus Methylomirabilis oxygeniifera]|uniref:Uncharacterized protein n=1 Tax=Methylomirabilis oxygeniifera TaxID=671143 RepID=D5MJ94_METO1|nr:protein of unknown function [Candidatus Methylomirabilis oxyfera]
MIRINVPTNMTNAPVVTDFIQSNEHARYLNSHGT